MRTIGYFLAGTLLLGSCGEQANTNNQEEPTQEQTMDPEMAQRVEELQQDLSEVREGLGEMYERLSTYYTENEGEFTKSNYAFLEPLFNRIEDMQERTDQYYSQLERGDDLNPENLKRMEYYSNVIFVKFFPTSEKYKALSGEHLLSEDDWSRAREYMINNNMEVDLDATYE